MHEVSQVAIASTTPPPALPVNPADIQRLYIAFFNRPADPSGMDFWTDAATKVGSLSVVQGAFSDSPEFKAIYSRLDPLATINAMYQNLFGRDAEPDGLQFWAKAYQNGLPLATIAYHIALGAQGTDSDAVNAKIAAATVFTANIDTTTEIVGYSGDAANNVARAWLGKVTDAASLATQTNQAVLNEAIASLRYATSPPPPGASSYNEGETGEFVLAARNVANGTVLNYALSGNGITAGDVGGGLSGSVTVMDGKATISVPLTADRMTEGAEILIAKLSTIGTATVPAVQVASVAFTINDSSVNSAPVFPGSGATAATVRENTTTAMTAMTTLQEFYMNEVSQVADAATTPSSALPVNPADIQRLYIAFFSRPADPSGLDFWSDAASKAGGLAVVQDAFSASAEFKAIYAGMDTLTTINAMYQNLFGRDAEPGGLQFWGKAHQNGLSLATIAYHLTLGAQGTDMVAVNAKLEAAAIFTANIDTTVETVGYSGDAANICARAWLAKVIDAETLAAQTAPDVLRETIEPLNICFKVYTLTAGASSYNEGLTGDVSLVTKNVANGTVLNYTLSGNGVTAHDVTGGLGGSVTVQNGKATISVPLTTDRMTEGAEILTVKLSTAGTATVPSVQVASTSFTINDSSVGWGSGNDVLYGSGAAELIEGLAGNDTIIGGGGLDTIFGGAGNDSITFANAAAQILGGTDTDTLVVPKGEVSSKFDLSSTKNQNRTSFSNALGQDVLVVGFENLDAASASNAITLDESAADTNSIILSGNADTITQMTLATGAVTVMGLGGNDSISTGANQTGATFSIDGGDGDDAITGGTGGDVIWGGAGNDTISGGADGGNDVVSGGAGADRITVSNTTGRAVIKLNLKTDLAAGTTLASADQWTGFASGRSKLDVSGATLKSSGGTVLSLTDVTVTSSNPATAATTNDTLAVPDPLTAGGGRFLASALASDFADLGSVANQGVLVFNLTADIVTGTTAGVANTLLNQAGIGEAASFITAKLGTATVANTNVLFLVSDGANQALLHYQEGTLDQGIQLAELTLVGVFVGVTYVTGGDII